MFNKLYDLFNKPNKQNKEDITFIEYETPSYLIPDIYCTISLMDENNKEILGVFEEDTRQMGFKKYDRQQMLYSIGNVDFKIKEHYTLPVTAKYVLVRNRELNLATAIAFKEPCLLDSTCGVFGINVCY